MMAMSDKEHQEMIREYVAEIERQCMFGDGEGDLKRARELIYELLNEIGCGEVVKAWDKVGK